MVPLWHLPKCVKAISTYLFQVCKMHEMSACAGVQAKVCPEEVSGESTASHQGARTQRAHCFIPYVVSERRRARQIRRIFVSEFRVP